MEEVTSVQLGIVSIHAPREGCDTEYFMMVDQRAKFQFTHPGRGATKDGVEILCDDTMFQFTHPGRGATYT